MQLTRLRIQNFRSILALDIDLDDTTVLIGPNNSGKSAILDALRIVLTRRWGQRGTGFTEHDVHRTNDTDDPRTLPPVTITLIIEEPVKDAWDADMVAALEDITGLTPDGRNVINLRVTCAWNEEKETFDPAWQFLDAEGQAMQEKRRAINLTGFFSYLPFFWLGALRDADNEFTPRAGHWGRLLKSINIPEEVETEVLEALATLDTKIVASDPRLAQIADLVGQATSVAIEGSPGGARLNTLPMAVEDMLLRTGVVIRNETTRPWLPLGSQGQGLQSLAVIYLFQAAVTQHLREAEKPGVEAVFALEEPEAHLHPQAARTLWERLKVLTGQKLISTHSPYFLQHVPLRDIRLVLLADGKTAVTGLPRPFETELPWNASLDGILRGSSHGIFSKSANSGKVIFHRWFDAAFADRLKATYRDDTDRPARAAMIDDFRHKCRVLPSEEDERDLLFHGRRVRGEIFFARRWILVEGVCEYLLIRAIADALEYSLDSHGVTIIDFQQSGNAGIYPALAEAFGIPWDMITDGDAESEKFRGQIEDRGFKENELTSRFVTLPPPRSLEEQLIADGHEPMLRDILHEISGGDARTCTPEMFLSRLKKRKTDYMSKMVPKILASPALARRMPTPFVNLIDRLKGPTP